MISQVLLARVVGLRCCVLKALPLRFMAATPLLCHYGREESGYKQQQRCSRELRVSRGQQPRSVWW